MLSQSLGKNNSNLKKISDIVKKKIRIVAIPLKIEDAERFIQAIINPFTFKNLEISANEMILTAGAQNKAALIGRDKRRLIEMQRITRDFFNRELKIV